MYVPVPGMPADMRPPMYPNMMPAYPMGPPPGWYENMPRPVEVSAQEFQDEEIEANDEAEEITQQSQ
jgi:hypothetical protein